MDKVYMKIFTGLKNKEGCRITGNFFTNRVPGFISFDYKTVKDKINDIEIKHPNLYERLDLSHKIVELSFGYIELQSLIAKKYGENSLNLVNTAKSIETQRNVSQSFNYYLRILPYAYKEVTYKEDANEIYKYTIQSNILVNF